MKQDLTAIITQACQKLFATDVTVELMRTDEAFGDYATNVALQLAGLLKQPPRQIADQLAGALRDPLIANVAVAGPGFINVTVSDQALGKAIAEPVSQTLAGQTVVAEYSDPNPFKVLHAGHLYTSIVGDAIANLAEAAGATVHRVNFGGDVGRHVGQTLWAILEDLGGAHPEKLTAIDESQRSEWMAAAYVKGTAAYEDDESARAKIIDLNKQVYAVHADNDHASPLAQIYWTCRQWSYDYFDAFYKRIGSDFEKYYPESDTAELGLQTVRKHIGPVFTESDGAIIFKGEDYGLHTRVFINSQGLPTYEAKDVGLIMKKWQDYHFDRSIIITGNEQLQYMTVVQKAIEQFAPELAQASSHLTHGIVKLAGGKKMSSRKGNILRAVEVLGVAATAAQAVNKAANDQIVLGAVKYAFLKNRIGGDIIYDPDESVALEGNSGPYLQYAHARACSILGKAGSTGQVADNFTPGERSLIRKMSEYNEVVDRAVAELMPHHICTYLYELSQVFNRFYENNRVIGDSRQTERLSLVQAYANTLKTGLQVLNISAPEKM